jgi:plasmid maintenance system antidote protein VapI
MHNAGCSIRKISRLMKMSRKTVRCIIENRHGDKIQSS